RCSETRQLSRNTCVCHTRFMLCLGEPKQASGGQVELTGGDADAFGAILGTDQELLLAKRTAARFAPTNLPILLLAETGTGKELFARAVHTASSRRTGTF